MGDGPLREQVLAAAKTNPRIRFRDAMPPAQVLQEMSQARFLIVPSVWYEGLPRTIVESLAVGTPVLAADIGSLTDLVRENGGGQRFIAGDVATLSNSAAQLCTDDAKITQMRVDARHEFLKRYTADANYQTLHSIYRSALSKSDE